MRSHRKTSNPSFHDISCLRIEGSNGQSEGIQWFLLPIVKYSYNTTFIPSILHFFTIKLCTTLVSLKAHVTPNRVHNDFFLARLQKWPWHYQMIFHIRFYVRLPCTGTPIEHGFKCTWPHTINYYPDLSSGPVNMLIRPTKYANSAKP